MFYLELLVFELCIFFSGFGIWVFLFTQVSFLKVVTHIPFLSFSRTPRMCGVIMRMGMKRTRKRRRRKKPPKTKRETVWRMALGPTGTSFPTVNMAVSLRPTQLLGHDVLLGLLEAKVASSSTALTYRKEPQGPQILPFPPFKHYLPLPQDIFNKMLTSVKMLNIESLWILLQLGLRLVKDFKHFSREPFQLSCVHSYMWDMWFSQELTYFP